MKLEITSLADVDKLKVDPQRRIFSATHEEILGGATTDIYFVRTFDILESMSLLDTPVTAEIFCRRDGILAGVNEVMGLLEGRQMEIWSLPEGSGMKSKEVVMRLKGSYREFGMYETTILGFLASSSGWATAAREAKDAAGDKQVICFGSRHIHPAVAPVMERAAMLAGCDGVSCILAAKLAGRQPQGTMPHALALIIGDTVKAARAYHQYMPGEAPRIVLVDTYKDEIEESLRVAEALNRDLLGVRLDTPAERRRDAGYGAGITSSPRPGPLRPRPYPGIRRTQPGTDQDPERSRGGLFWGRQLHFRSGADRYDDGSERGQRQAMDETWPHPRGDSQSQTKKNEIAKTRLFLKHPVGHKAAGLLNHSSLRRNKITPVLMATYN